MELKYKNWNDININTFNKLNSVQFKEIDDDTMLNANVKLLSILCDVDEDEIDEYTGYKEIRLSDDELTKFYQEFNKNQFDLFINEYLIIYNQKN